MTKQLNKADIKRKLWDIVSKEGIIITNQNIDWLIDRVFEGGAE